MFHGFGHLLLLGSWMTIKLALAGLLIGLALGLIGAAAALSSFAPLRWLANTWNTLMRGLPEMLLVLILYYGAGEVLSRITGEHVALSAFVAGATALGIAFGAYAAEVFRSALLEIPKGQREAAMALGLSRRDTFTRITLPQVWRLALPGLGNLFIVLLKDTALVSIIGLDELMRQAENAANFTKLPFSFYLAASGIYLLLTFVAMQIIQHLERHAHRGQRKAA
ncbi:MAG: ABC transporter permease subunit [Rhodocyclaceae bacterium]|nr:ABC transporter permease subunit [Rhodocyclaceae bacterium]